jgi:DNA-binding NarL/FixJ family response regulator
MQKTIRVLLADDHPVVRSGIRTILAGEKDITVVGEATNGNEVWQQCAETNPDVLLLDLNMPGPPPAETVSFLCQQSPGLKILVLTAYDDDVFVRGSIAAGVVGYMLKEEAPEIVVRAIRAVMQGDTWYSQRIMNKLTRWQATESAAVTEADLSQREIEILKLIAQGWDNARIADELHLAEQTVRNRVSRIYTKIGASSRAEAIVWARERSLE